MGGDLEELIIRRTCRLPAVEGPAGEGATAARQPDTRYPIAPELVDLVREMIDLEITRRLPVGGRLVVDPDILEVALPLSGKGIGGGFGVLPRGSITRVEGELLRFFVYWKERARRTDFDLSAVMLDGTFKACGWLSYTNLTAMGGVHSGDITEAPNGASEFIDIRLDGVPAQMVLPQVNVYSGEGFEEVLESFFGYMARDAYQRGQPFEPRTVRAKSELRGAGRIALPLVFFRGADGWRVKWLHLYLSGAPDFNRVESNHVTASMLARAVVEREYLHVGYLVGLMSAGTESALWDGGPITEPVTFIGLSRPEGLPAGSQVITPENLSDLIPA
ncbi:TerD family protein [Nocardia acidivorans]|uniref:TerD family protein n=1 Tax=Nocardia acidivorans TaxID=404580 RepID=UPI000831709B|nr:TerD family protein [Nocardia acidivorans]